MEAQEAPVPTPPPANKRPPTSLRRACYGGAKGVAAMLIICCFLSAILQAGRSPDPFHWVHQMKRIVEIVMGDPPKQEDVSIIFAFAMVLSVFFQVTVAQYLAQNGVYEHTELVFFRPALRRWRFEMVPVKAFSGEAALEAILNQVFLVLLAAASIVLLNRFYFHIATSFGYVVLVSVVDVVYWLCLRSNRAQTLYRGIPMGILGRKFFRDLVFRLDLVGLVPIGLMILLGAVVGLPEEPPEKYEIFYTGIVSYYLVVTPFLATGLLYEWRGILTGMSMIDVYDKRRAKT